MTVRADVEAHARVQEFLHEVLPKWQQRMHLSEVEIELVFLDSFDPEEDQDGDHHTTMICEGKWNYLVAKIKVFLPSAIRWSLTELEKTLVHELCHILLMAEQSCISKPADVEKMELSTEMASRAIYDAYILQP